MDSSLPNRNELGSFKWSPLGFLRGCVNEFCGSALLTFVITMSAARWPTMGSLMYGLTIYWCLQMHKFRLFNPVLNLFFRPLFFEAVEKEAADNEYKENAGPSCSTVPYKNNKWRWLYFYLLALIESCFCVLGALAMTAAIRGLTDGAIPADPYVLAEEARKLSLNQTVAKTTDPYSDLKVDHAKLQHSHDKLGSLDSPYKAAAAEFIGLLLLWTAVYDNAPGQKRAIALGVATTVASFSLAQFSGGIFNFAIQVSMATVIAKWDFKDQSTMDIMRVSGWSSGWLLFFMGGFYIIQAHWSKYDYRPRWLQEDAKIDWTNVYEETRDDEGVVTKKLIRKPPAKEMKFEKEEEIFLTSSRAKDGPNWAL